MLSDIKVNKYVCSDLNSDLISLWNLIKNNSVDSILKEYEKRWIELNKDDNIDRKKQYYNEIRTNFNINRNPHDFMFLMRTAINGMPRYNKKGNFNTSFHLTRNGMQPARLEKITSYWKELLMKKNVTFVSKSYEEITSTIGDVLYLDPPYYNTKGIYYGTIEYEKLWNWLRIQKGNYFLSFDGKTSLLNHTYDIPKDIYSQHLYINSGNSSWKRLKTDNKYVDVKESLYCK